MRRRCAHSTELECGVVVTVRLDVGISGKYQREETRGTACELPRLLVDLVIQFRDGAQDRVSNPLAGVGI